MKYKLKSSIIHPDDLHYYNIVAYDDWGNYTIEWYRGTDTGYLINGIYEKTIDDLIRDHGYIYKSNSLEIKLPEDLFEL